MAKACPAQAVEEWVNETLAAKKALYTLDADLLRELEPDVIVTQQLCDVGAIDYASVVMIASSLPKETENSQSGILIAI